MKPSSHVAVLVTVSSAGEGRKIARALVGERLAACVNALPRVRSVYWWKGKIESSAEELLIAKTRRSRLEALVRRVKELHSYTVPEVIALPVVGGHGEYLRWIDGSIGKKP